MGRAQRDENTAHYIDPYAQCLPTGVPRQMGNFRPRQILQGPGLISIVNEAGGHVYRVVYTDGRPHVPAAIRLWMGDSRGRWEGRTLVIETTNTNGRWWDDSHGHFASVYESAAAGSTHRSHTARLRESTSTVTNADRPLR